MGMVKLEKTKQKRLKVVSKIMYVLSKIGKIFTRIGVVFAILAMCIMIPVLSNFEVHKVDDVIEIKYKEKEIKIEETDGKYTAVIEGQKIEFGKVEGKEDFDKVISVFEENSKEKIIAVFAVTTVFAVVELVLTSIILSNLEDLFKNIYNEDTPFIKENVDYIKKIAYFMIAVTALGLIYSIVSNLIIPERFNYNFGSGVVGILIVFAIRYIFEYGYEMQLDSETKIYGEDEE